MFAQATQTAYQITSIFTGEKPVQPPGWSEVLYVYFLFFFTLFMLNTFLCLDRKEEQYNIRAALLYTLGSFVMLVAILSPDIFVYQNKGFHYLYVTRGLFLYSIFFTIFFAGYARVISVFCDKSGQQYINTVFIVTGNLLWVVPLIMVGRTWYWAPVEWGYYGGFYTLALVYYLPVTITLPMLRWVSLKLLEKKPGGILGYEIGAEKAAG